jgi:hypothetical protein
VGGGRDLGIEDDLRDAKSISQIDENQAAQVSASIDPSGQLDRLSFIVNG